MITRVQSHQRGWWMLHTHPKREGCHLFPFVFPFSRAASRREGRAKRKETPERLRATLVYVEYEPSTNCIGGI